MGVAIIIGVWLFMRFQRGIADYALEKLNSLQDNLGINVFSSCVGLA